MDDDGADPRGVADQLGHTLDVNLNVYTRVGFERPAEAVNRLDLALQVNEMEFLGVQGFGAAWNLLISLERETGIEPATNSLEG
jgi:hypothetical protein